MASEYDTTEQLTGHLRWQDGVLQQRWQITHYRNGARYKYTEEWRDVPSYNSHDGT
jgi:hypothetical protein